MASLSDLRSACIPENVTGLSNQGMTTIKFLLSGPAFAWHVNFIYQGMENNNRNFKKEEVGHRIDKLDPNNNKNRPNRPLVKRRRRIVRDDGFEHRTSSETAS